jgi:hypothetical protein
MQRIGKNEILQTNQTTIVYQSDGCGDFCCNLVVSLCPDDDKPEGQDPADPQK